MSDTQPHVMIIGAGLAGSLLACLLGKRGYQVDVYERRGDPRARGFIGGRSINLALSTRGIHALDRAGLKDAVLRDAIPMPGRMIHAVDGTLTFQPYSKDPTEAINSVSRGGLNLTLLDAADACDTVSLHFDQRCLDIDLNSAKASFAQGDSDEIIDASANVIIGTDGAFSAVRSAMQKTDRFTYSQTYLEHGYKELTIPPTADGTFAMEPQALHIWPRGGFMMIALPNADKSFTCTLFWPFDGETGFPRVDDETAIMRRFHQWFADAIPLMPTLATDFQKNPTSSLVTIRCNPWQVHGKVLIMGDASHAIVPFYGQGMNAAFEDCAIFDEAIDRFGPDWDRLLPWFSEHRKPDADAIADLFQEVAQGTIALLIVDILVEAQGLFPVALPFVLLAQQELAVEVILVVQVLPQLEALVFALHPFVDLDGLFGAFVEQVV